MAKQIEIETIDDLNHVLRNGTTSIHGSLKLIMDTVKREMKEIEKQVSAMNKAIHLYVEAIEDDCEDK